MKRIFLLTLMVVLSACSSGKKETGTDSTAVQADTAAAPVESWLIKQSTAGPFKIEQSIRQLDKKGYLLLSKSDTNYTDEGSEVVPVFIVNRNGKDILKLVPEFEFNQMRYEDTIGAIEILSPEIKTEKSFAVGMSIEEFKKLYPDVEVSFSYVGKHFWLSTKEVTDVQFIVPESAYKGKADVLYNSDLVTIDYGMIDPNAKVTSIRIWR